MLTEHRFQLTGAERGMPRRVWGHVKESVSNMAGKDDRGIQENGKGKILMSKHLLSTLLPSSFSSLSSSLTFPSDQGALATI